MTNAITAITTAVTAESLWASFGNLAPFLAVIIPVALGMYFLRKLLKGSAKGKTRI